MADYKQLCAELVDDLELCDWPHKLKETIRADIDCARAALAEPEPQRHCIYNPVQIAECGGPCEQGPEHCDCGELWVTEPELKGPTDDELDELFTEIDQSGEPESWRAYARAVLARWGNHPGSPDSSTPQPAAGEVAELVTWLRTTAEALRDGNIQTPRLTRAAELLEQLSPPQPVPVSERLPEPGDTDAKGRCWWFDIDGQWYFRSQIEINVAGLRRPTHWLPAHALPQPS